MAGKKSPRSSARPSTVLVSSSISDSDLSWLIAALSGGQTVDPQDILPALLELQERRRPTPMTTVPDVHPGGCACSSCRQVDTLPTAAPLQVGERIRDTVTGDTGTVVSVTGWVEDRIQVRRDKPGKPSGKSDSHRYTWPRARDCVRVGGAL